MFHDFVEFIFPRFCSICQTVLSRNEKVVCIQCLHALPVTNYHQEINNPVEAVFFGRIPVERAASLLLFEKKGMVQKLIHNLKYRGQEEIGAYLGSWMGNELREEENFQKVTLVIPVPLHKKKLKKRGFNQVEKFGKEIARALNVPYADNFLLKKDTSQTQTIKKRFARWGSISETFIVENPNELINKHVLLVDDLVTTGATLEACAEKLLKIQGVKISIATMAFTH